MTLDPALLALLTGLVIAALLDTATGMLAALASDTWSRKYAAEWLRSHLFFRVLPIAVAAIGGSLMPEPLGATLLAAAAFGAATYAAEVVGSVADNLRAMATKDKGAPATLTVVQAAPLTVTATVADGRDTGVWVQETRPPLSPVRPPRKPRPPKPPVEPPDGEGV